MSINTNDNVHAISTYIYLHLILNIKCFLKMPITSGTEYSGTIDNAPMYDVTHKKTTNGIPLKTSGGEENNFDTINQVCILEYVWRLISSITILDMGLFV